VVKLFTDWKSTANAKTNLEGKTVICNEEEKLICRSEQRKKKISVIRAPCY
jgi:hypothetical protein